MGKNDYLVTGVISCEDVDIFAYREDIKDYFCRLELEEGEEPALVLFAGKDTKPSGPVSTGSFSQDAYTMGAFVVAVVTLYQTSEDIIRLLTEQLETENIKQGLAFVASHPSAKKAVEYFCERWGWKVKYLKLHGKLSEDSPRSDKENVSPNAKTRKDLSQQLRTEKDRLAEAMISGDEAGGEQALDNVIRCEEEGMKLADKSPAYIGT